MDEILRKINESIEASSRVTRELLVDIKDSEIDLAALKTEVVIIKENVATLNRVVKDGNGHVSLITKIELINQKLGIIDKLLERLEEKAEEEYEARERLAAEVEEIERRVRTIDQVLTRLTLAEETRARQEMEDMRASIADSEELEAAQKVKDIEERKERNVLLWRVGSAVIAAVVGAALAYFGLG